MADPFKYVAIPMVAGIQTNVDDKSISPPYVRTLQNGAWFKDNLIQKRYGHSQITASAVSPIAPTTISGTLATLFNINAYKNTLLVSDITGTTGAYNPDGTYNGNKLSLVTHNGPNCGIFGLVSGQFYIRQILSSLRYADSALYLTTRVNVAETFDGGTSAVEVCFIDETSGSVVKFDNIAGGTKPKVVITNDGSTRNAHVIYGNGTNLTVTRYLLESPGTITTTNIATDLVSGGPFDCEIAANDASSYAVAYNTSTGPGVALVRVTHTDGTGTVRRTAATAVSTIAVGTRFNGGVAETAMAWCEKPVKSTIKIIIYDGASTLGLVLAATTLDTGLEDGVNITLGWDSVTTAKWYTIYNQEQTTAVVRDRLVFWRSCTNAGVLGTIATVLRHSTLASRVMVYNNQPFIFVLFDDGLQNTIFLYSLGTPNKEYNLWGLGSNAWSVAGKAICGVPMVGNAASVRPGTYLPHISAGASSSVFHVPLLESKLLSNAPQFSKVTPRLITMNMTTYSDSSEIGDIFYSTGGMITEFDGSNFQENGFYLFPNISSSSLAGGTGGSLTPSATYTYKIYLESINAFNKRILSNFGTATITLSALQNRVLITVPTITHSNKQNVIFGIDQLPNFVFYRNTPANQFIFNRVSSPDVTTSFAGGSNAYFPNSTGLDSLQFTDDMSDVNAALNEIDPLSGQLQHGAIGSSSFITLFNDRIAAGSNIYPNRVYLSKKQPTDSLLEPFSFNLALYRDIGDSSALIAGVQQDNALILFKQKSIYLLTGQGPDNTGSTAQGNWDIQRLSSDVGCINVRSIARTPDGTMFLSSRGLCLIDRSFNVIFVGLPVKDFNALTFTAAVVVPTQYHIRFLTAEGPTLVYDYIRKQWVTFTGDVKGTGAALYNNNFSFVNSATPAIGFSIETSSAFADRGGGIPYSMVIELAWLPKVHGIQDQVTIGKLDLFGKRFSAHDLKSTWYTDYSATTTLAKALADQGTPAAVDFLQWELDPPPSHTFQGLTLRLEDLAPGFSSPCTTQGYALNEIGLSLSDSGMMALVPPNKKG